ncbi:hypothetical protein H9P43_000217 [Blastocladiella emersonii ATCC 22665]|nr:hypothetical protein H9P43_000217 [Blastocladiella emersonii ATCC 22665]
MSVVSHAAAGASLASPLPSPLTVSSSAALYGPHDSDDDDGGGPSPTSATATTAKGASRRRQRIETIADDRVRRATLLKRRQGLYKKAYELATLCDCQLAIVMFDSNGRLHQFSTADAIDDVLLRFATHYQPAIDIKTARDFGGDGRTGTSSIVKQQTPATSVGSTSSSSANPDRPLALLGGAAMSPAAWPTSSVSFDDDESTAAPAAVGAQLGDFSDHLFSPSISTSNPILTSAGTFLSPQLAASVNPGAMLPPSHPGAILGVNPTRTRSSGAALGRRTTPRMRPANMPPIPTAHHTAPPNLFAAAGSATGNGGSGFVESPGMSPMLIPAAPGTSPFFQASRSFDLMGLGSPVAAAVPSPRTRSALGGPVLSAHDDGSSTGGAANPKKRKLTADGGSAPTGPVAAAAPSPAFFGLNGMQVVESPTMLVHSGGLAPQQFVTHHQQQAQAQIAANMLASPMFTPSLLAANPAATATANAASWANAAAIANAANAAAMAAVMSPMTIAATPLAAYDAATAAVMTPLTVPSAAASSSANASASLDPGPASASGAPLVLPPTRSLSAVFPDISLMEYLTQNESGPGLGTTAWDVVQPLQPPPMPPMHQQQQYQQYPQHPLRSIPMGPPTSASTAGQSIFSFAAAAAAAEAEAAAAASAASAGVTMFTDDPEDFDDEFEDSSDGGLADLLSNDRIGSGQAPMDILAQLADNGGSGSASASAGKYRSQRQLAADPTSFDASAMWLPQLAAQQQQMHHHPQHVAQLANPRSAVPASALVFSVVCNSTACTAIWLMRTANGFAGRSPNHIADSPRIWSAFLATAFPPEHVREFGHPMTTHVMRKLYEHWARAYNGRQPAAAVVEEVTVGSPASETASLTDAPLAQQPAEIVAVPEELEDEETSWAKESQHDLEPGIDADRDAMHILPVYFSLIGDSTAHHAALIYLVSHHPEAATNAAPSYVWSDIGPLVAHGLKFSIAQPNATCTYFEYHTLVAASSLDWPTLDMLLSDSRFGVTRERVARLIEGEIAQGKLVDSLRAAQLAAGELIDLIERLEVSYGITISRTWAPSFAAAMANGSGHESRFLALLKWFDADVLGDDSMREAMRTAIQPALCTFARSGHLAPVYRCCELGLIPDDAWSALLQHGSSEARTALVKLIEMWVISSMHVTIAYHALVVDHTPAPSDLPSLLRVCMKLGLPSSTAIKLLCSYPEPLSPSLFTLIETVTPFGTLLEQIADSLTTSSRRAEWSNVEIARVFACAYQSGGAANAHNSVLAHDSRREQRTAIFSALLQTALRHPTTPGLTAAIFVFMDTFDGLLDISLKTAFLRDHFSSTHLALMADPSAEPYLATHRSLFTRLVQNNPSFMARRVVAWLDRVPAWVWLLYAEHATALTSNVSRVGIAAVVRQKRRLGDVEGLEAIACVYPDAMRDAGEEERREYSGEERARLLVRVRCVPSFVEMLSEAAW